MKRVLLLVAAASVCMLANAAPWPYDEKADATVDVHHALAAAQADHKQVLLVFGANWCPDCRALDKAMHGSSQHLIDSRFEVVKDRCRQLRQEPRARQALRQSHCQGHSRGGGARRARACHLRHPQRRTGERQDDVRTGDFRFPVAAGGDGIGPLRAGVLEP